MSLSTSDTNLQEEIELLKFELKLLLDLTEKFSKKENNQRFTTRFDLGAEEYNFVRIPFGLKTNLSDAYNELFSKKLKSLRNLQDQQLAHRFERQARA